MTSVTQRLAVFMINQGVLPNTTPIMIQAEVIRYQAHFPLLSTPQLISIYTLIDLLHSSNL